MSSSVLSGELECELGPSVSQHFEHKNSVLLGLLHCKKHEIALRGTLISMLMQFVPDNCSCVVAPSHLQCCRDSLAFVNLCCLMPVKSAKPSLVLHYTIVLLFSQIIMTGNSYHTANNFHFPVMRGRELCCIAWRG